MPTTGEKVKMLRVSRGLSQEQLAGKELTRSFISLVEKGKSAPSVATLQIIAKRLAKPIEFFLDDREDVAELEVIKILEESAHAAVANKQWDQAIKHALAAVHMAEKCGRIEIELRTRWMLADTYVRSRRYEAAFGEYDGLYETYRTIGDKTGVVKALGLLGQTCYHNRDLIGARRYFERALAQAEGLKSLMQVKLEISNDYGLCLMRLGETEEALKAYQRALQECNSAEYPSLWAMFNWNIAGAYRNAGQLTQALHHINLAREWFEDHRRPETPYIRQRYATILGDMGLWNQHDAIIRECILVHQNAGNHGHQASAILELARYHLAAASPEDALSSCQEALTLLDIEDDADIRGRVYAMLGQIYEVMGYRNEAIESLRVASALLRQVKAGFDLRNVNLRLDRLRKDSANQLTSSLPASAQGPHR